MRIDKPDLVKALELLDNDYAGIAKLESQLLEIVPDGEDKDELREIFRRYRECHHKLRRGTIGVIVPLIVVSSSG
jgi:hypothetical protein